MVGLSWSSGFYSQEVKKASYHGVKRNLENISKR